LNGMNGVIFDLAGWWQGVGVGFWVFGDGAVRNPDQTPLDLVAAPGTRPRLLTNTLSYETTRVFAASAGAVALVETTNGDAGRNYWDDKTILICRAGARCRRIAGGSKVAVDPAWSPDGTTLASVTAP